MRLKIVMNRLYNILGKKIVSLGPKLKSAGIYDTKAQFLKKIITLSFMGSLGLTFFLFLILGKSSVGEKKVSFVLFLIGAFFVMIGLLFNYFLRIPDLAIMKKGKLISKEIIFAGRFLLIELESGVPIYHAMKNVAVNYPAIGKYIDEIIHKVDLGSSMDEAIVETIQHSPSNDLNKILWQILNTLKTGSDIRWSLSSVLDQIVREQQILVKEYGRKLNPLAMFYMMIAVIIPSLGTTMLTVLATFLNLHVSLFVLIIFVGFFAVMQFMFIAMVKNARPPVEM
ncbi:hypothetical protein COV93_00045 [Candidatus Woesearchaeota archaeon CG11_big_fil_rev_8_21_14_0_20_43_8]|nr:MAG: hypothetical protein COV93_00045 [Candidatus Woesearchaeota archaeon CG11_big_fil_rev_8_21_14_0_20_43_8]PIO06685.1 MAG: hypothetical protein COT47_03215 [Candidatus Woesearchaeota archaeon CG08_land_8_20_14_0_20_43_7]